MLLRAYFSLRQGPEGSSPQLAQTGSSMVPLSDESSKNPDRKRDQGANGHKAEIRALRIRPRQQYDLAGNVPDGVEQHGISDIDPRALGMHMRRPQQYGCQGDCLYRKGQ